LIVQPNIDIDGQIQYYQEYWAKEKQRRQEKENAIGVKGKANLKWLERNGISLSSLPKANPSEIIYTCDSTLLLKRISGDTTTIWTVGGETYLDTIRAQKWVNNKGFGKTAYIKGVNYQGNIAYVMLSPKTFHVKNDSLFELDLFYRISADSMSNLNSKMFRAKNDTLKKEIRQLIRDNKYTQFKLIFHPEMFENEDVYTQNIKNDSITLSNSWKVGNKKYYEVTINNKLGKYDTKGVHLFDENYRLLKYDGCNEDEIEKLKTENEIKK